MRACALAFVFASSRHVCSARRISVSKVKLDESAWASHLPDSISAFISTVTGGSAVYVCTGLARRAYRNSHRESSEHCGEDFWLGASAGDLIGSTPEFFWHSIWSSTRLAACMAPDAYFTMCMKRLEGIAGLDPFSNPEQVLSLTRQNELDQRHDGSDRHWRVIAGLVSISPHDPTVVPALAATFRQLLVALNPSIYEQTFPNIYGEMMTSALGNEFSARRFQESFREFLGGTHVHVSMPGYGARLGPQLCEWVPETCETRRTTRPIIDLGPDRNGWRAPGSELEQPPWNHWPEKLTDQILSDVMFSLQGVLVQSVTHSTNRSWEVELSGVSQACGMGAGAVYAVPTAFLAGFEVRPGYLPYGVDMYFSAQRDLLAIYDANAAKNEPSCWRRAEVSGAAERKWAELRLLGMAAVMAMQPYVYHAVEKVAFGGVFWSGVFDLPAGHRVRDIIAIFAHRSLEKANEIMDATLDSGDFFRLQTAFSIEGWHKLLDHTLERALRVEYPTGTPEYWVSRKLSESDMPLVNVGSRIRAIQKNMIVCALENAGIPEDLSADEDLQHFVIGLLEQWPNTRMDALRSRDDLADLLSEALYRMSVTHTQTHHNQICHSAMANPRAFPFQLTRGPNGDVFPMSHRHLGTMMIWDAGTEPTPHLDYPLADSDIVTDEGYKTILQDYVRELRVVEEDVRRYNRDRCNRGDYATSAGCRPYSCLMPLELMMSYGV